MKLDFETDNGSGPKATMGVIVLKEDETLEGELAHLLRQDGVALYHSRIPMATEVNPDTLRQMQADLPAAAAMLPSTPHYDVIAYGCTSAATEIGPKGVRDAIQTVRPDVQITDPLSAIITACDALGAIRLGFLTPYVPKVSAHMCDALEATGRKIAGFGSFEEGDDRVVARITPDTILRGITQVAAQQNCDAIVVACTNLRGLGIITKAESITGVPVITSNQALGWHMLRLANLTPQGTAPGALFLH